MNVSVVVPTRNAGVLLDELLATLAKQRFPGGSVELVAADSGSTDGTREKLRKAGARVIDVPDGTFDHGSTRDLAIANSRGDVAVLIVQDAIPGSTTWLEGLVREFEIEEVAGTTCRRVARADAPALTAMRLRESPHGSRERRVSKLPPGRPLEALAPKQRFELCTFDHVCSAVRRSVWERIPFGPCPFAEDLSWSRKVIAAGHTITYTPDVFVVHSRDRSILREYRRTYLAHYALSKLFGLRTVPTRRLAWSSLWSSGPLIRRALAEEPSLLRGIRGALRAPVERLATAIAQYQGARDAAQGKAARGFREI